MKKTYDQLTIQDNFMFQKVMSDKNICIRVLNRLLNIDIKDISYIEKEKSLDVRLDSKGIRLDVYVNDEAGTVFNIEMQTTSSMKELAKRIRYYQAVIDISLLGKGNLYKDLSNTYIIFICTFGIFTGNRHKYTFKEICLEDYDIHLNDGTTKMFLSTKGKMNDDIPKPLKIFLDYVDGKAPADNLTEEINKAVITAKNRTEWRRDFMTLQLLIEERELEALEKGIGIGIEKGHAVGLNEGRAEAASEINALINILIKSGRYSDLERSATDPAYQQQLINELLPPQ